MFDATFPVYLSDGWPLRFPGPPDGTVMPPEGVAAGVTERRPLAAGVLIALAGVPPIVTYGAAPLGYVGVALVAVGGVIGYGAWRAD